MSVSSIYVMNISCPDFDLLLLFIVRESMPSSDYSQITKCSRILRFTRHRHGKFNAAAKYK